MTAGAAAGGALPRVVGSITSLALLLVPLVCTGAPPVADSAGIGGRVYYYEDNIGSQHPFSLDHFLEGDPYYFLGRFGPIGAGTRLSLYGMGWGRALVLVEGIPLNDPQSGMAPVEALPTSHLSAIALLPGRPGETPYSSPEGAISLVPRKPPSRRPSTSITLAKATRNLRERRVSFSSLEASLGIDVGYDELLDDGYSRRPGVSIGPLSSRTFSLSLRGDLGAGEGYRFSFLRFTQGGSEKPGPETHRTGHLGVMAVRFSPFAISGFVRGFRTSLGDSSSLNETTGMLLSWRPSVPGAGEARAYLGYEETSAEERVEGGDRLYRAGCYRLGMAARTAAGPFTLGGSLGVEGIVDHGWGWGGGAGVQWEPSEQVSAYAAAGKGYRMPTLSELFSPPHQSGGTAGAQWQGNKDLRPEILWEGRAGVRIEGEAIGSELAIAAVRGSDLIKPRFLPTEGIYRPSNRGGWGRVGLVEDRTRISVLVRSLRVSLAAGGFYAWDKQEAYFAGVPRVRLVSRVSLARELFEGSSAIRLSADYRYVGGRSGPGAASLSPYGLVDVELDFRLIDAHIYLQLLNVFDRSYQTIAGYPMTPRTFVYGVQWAIFD